MIKRKTIAAIMCLLISMSYAAEEKTNRLVIPNDQNDRVFIEMTYGKSKPVNPEALDRLFGMKITKVTYAFSDYHSVRDYDQKKLNEKRITTLKELVPQLVKDSLIEWNEVAQNECSSQDCAKGLFHGFVIEFENEALFSVSNLKKQYHVIQAGERSTITGEHGTEVIVPANAFVDASGRTVEGKITVMLQEAIDAKDILTAGLSTSTSKGENLQSGGMINLEANQNGKTLNVSNGKSIQVEIPSDSTVDGMQFFKGVRKDGRLLWEDPEELLEEQIVVADEPVAMGVFWSKSKWVQDISNINWEGASRLEKITLTKNEKNNVIERKGYSVPLGLTLGLNKMQAKRVKVWFDQGRIKNNFVPTDFWGGHWEQDTVQQVVMDWGVDAAVVEGQNTFKEDKDIRYLFNMSKLGWANIDRLAKYSNSRKAKLEVQLENDDFENVSICLVIPGKDMYLPGYKMKSGNYCFTHGDYEQNYKLPIGDKAIITVISPDDNFAYYAIKEFSITEDQVHDLELKHDLKKNAVEAVKAAI